MLLIEPWPQTMPKTMFEPLIPCVENEMSKYLPLSASKSHHCWVNVMPPFATRPFCSLVLPPLPEQTTLLKSAAAPCVAPYLLISPSPISGMRSVLRSFQFHSTTVFENGSSVSAISSAVMARSW